jgi:four helix bundle protein
LTIKLREAAASIGADLAEGYGRHSRNELRSFSMIANGSRREVPDLLAPASALGAPDQDSLDELASPADGTAKLIVGIKRSLG